MDGRDSPGAPKERTHYSRKRKSQLGRATDRRHPRIINTNRLNQFSTARRSPGCIEGRLPCGPCVVLILCCESFRGLAKMEQGMRTSRSKARCREQQHDETKDVGVLKQSLVWRVGAHPSDEILESSNVFSGKNRPRFGKMESWAHQWLTISVSGKQTRGNMQINNEILNVQASGAQA